MEKREYQVTAVSEIFPGSANPAEADLTPRAIKSALRFWFRAMMGRVIGNNLPSLKTLEQRAFGAAGDEEGSSAAPFQIRLSEISDPPAPWEAPKEAEAGFAYLGFSLRDRQRNMRQCYPFNTTFKISIRFRARDARLASVLDGCLWLLSYFGGIGARSRRTFGALSIQSTEESEGDFFRKPRAEEISDYYTTRLEAIEKTFQDFAGVTQAASAAPAFSSFFEWSGRILLSGDWNDIVCAQDDIGRILRAFRTDQLGSIVNSARVVQFRMGAGTLRTQDYRMVASPFMGTIPPSAPGNDLINDVLGLPMVFFSRTRNQQNRQLPPSQRVPDQAQIEFSRRKGNDWEKIERRSSPLIFRPVLLADDHYAVIAFVLFAPILPVGFAPRIKAGTHRPHNLTSPTLADLRTRSSILFKELDRIFGARGSFPLP